MVTYWEENWRLNNQWEKHLMPSCSSGHFKFHNSKYKILISEIYVSKSNPFKNKLYTHQLLFFQSGVEMLPFDVGFMSQYEW